MHSHQPSGTPATIVAANYGSNKIWFDEMAEVKETFRRVARVRSSFGTYSGTRDTKSAAARVTAPILSRNRRARAKSQVPGTRRSTGSIPTLPVSSSSPTSRSRCSCCRNNSTPQADGDGTGVGSGPNPLTSSVSTLASATTNASSCSIPPAKVGVPVRVLREIQNNRSQSPFVAVNHLHNVLGMCKRIRSQSTLTERKKNPHDPTLYPVFLRRPRPSPTARSSFPSPCGTNCSCCQSQNQLPYHTQSQDQNQAFHNTSKSLSPMISPSPNNTKLCRVPSPTLSLTPTPTPSITYSKQPSFKPLFDICNGVYPGSKCQKCGPCGQCTTLTDPKPVVRASAQEKPPWATNYKHVIKHPIIDESPPPPPLKRSLHYYHHHHHHHHHIQKHDGQNYHHLQRLHDDHRQTSQSPNNMVHHSLDSWPPPNFNNGTTNHDHSMLPPYRSNSVLSFSDNLHQDDLDCHQPSNVKPLNPPPFDPSPDLTFNLMDSDRRPHSENDLNLHSVNFYAERPPSRCNKRPLSSSCSWTTTQNNNNQLGHRKMDQFNHDPLSFNITQDVIRFGGNNVEAWSPQGSISHEPLGPSIFVPRDLDGNALRSTSSASSSEQQNQQHTHGSSCKRCLCHKSLAKDLLELSPKPIHHHGFRSTMISNNQQSISSFVPLHRTSKSIGGPSPPRAGSMLSRPTAKRSPNAFGGNITTSNKLIKTTSKVPKLDDDLESIAPNRWARRLASKLAASDNQSYNKENTNKARGQIRSKAPNNTNSNKNRVKFASQGKDTSIFRNDSESLAKLNDMGPSPADLLSWDRDTPKRTNCDENELEEPSEHNIFDKAFDKALVRDMESLHVSSKCASTPLANIAKSLSLPLKPLLSSTSSSPVQCSTPLTTMNNEVKSSTQEMEALTSMIDHMEVEEGTYKDEMLINLSNSKSATEALLIKIKEHNASLDDVNMDMGDLSIDDIFYPNEHENGKTSFYQSHKNTNEATNASFKSSTRNVMINNK